MFVNFKILISQWLFSKLICACRFIYTGKVTYDSSEVINWISPLDVACRFELDNLVVTVGGYLVNHQKEWIQRNIYAIRKCALSSSLLNELLNYCNNIMLSSPEV